MCGKIPDSLESFWTVWKVSWQSGKFLDSLESFGQSGKFQDSLESFRTAWKVSGQSGKFPKSLERVRTVWKVSGQSGKFQECLESFQTVWKGPAIYAMAYMACMWKRFTHFWRFFVAKTIYALRPESFCAWNSANRKVWTFWVSVSQSVPGSSPVASHP